MSNLEIITNETALINFPYDGSNLFTFEEWKKQGYFVRKGEKAFLKTKLWRKQTKLNKKTGHEESYYILVNAYLFNKNQVDKMKLAAK